MESVRNASHQEIADLADEVQKSGPAINRAAKKLGQHKETARYRYQNMIMKERRGYLQAAVEYGRLGLSRIMALVEFDPSLKRVAPMVLQAMNAKGFLVAYVRSSYDDMYITDFSVPIGFHSSVERSLEYLRTTGIITRLEFSRFDWLRVLPINSRAYDFKKEIWDIEWSAETTNAGHTPVPIRPMPVASIDHTDLLILKELQKDANRSMSDIASSLHEDRKKVRWHAKEHVFGQNLVSGYRFRWMGEFDIATQHVIMQRHKYANVSILCRGLDDKRLKAVREYLTSLPMIFCEAVGTRNYYAQLALPLRSLNDGIKHLNKKLAGDDSSIMVIPTDQRDALAFTLPYERHDEESNAWVFDEAGFKESFRKIVEFTQNRGYDRSCF
ncbi:MAG: winged helix-turn-helix domain-containing protein [Nitrososphaerota archaeon]|nr:winged helix-turn-helix domain-containing protein [Nitrososphaerota archaeon]